MSEFINQYLAVFLIFCLYIWGTKKFLANQLELNYRDKLVQQNKGLWIVSVAITISQLGTLIFFKHYGEYIQPTNLRTSIFVLLVLTYIFLTMQLAKVFINSRESYWHWTKKYLTAFFISPFVALFSKDELRSQLNKNSSASHKTLKKWLLIVGATSVTIILIWALIYLTLVADAAHTIKLLTSFNFGATALAIGLFSLILTKSFIVTSNIKYAITGAFLTIIVGSYFIWLGFHLAPNWDVASSQNFESANDKVGGIGKLALAIIAVFPFVLMLIGTALIFFQLFRLFGKRKNEDN